MFCGLEQNRTKIRFCHHDQKKEKARAALSEQLYVHKLAQAWETSGPLAKLGPAQSGLQGVAGAQDPVCWLDPEMKPCRA